MNYDTLLSIQNKVEKTLEGCFTIEDEQNREFEDSQYFTNLKIQLQHNKIIKI
ncbi:MAG: hypothetical protein KAR54_03370 [Candidatus Pacebacteria bacterium]|nr:hypothetical protein [Candidatus Paceibacterota bacterium]